ncbi:hypothetical protein BDZ97DRAFT_1815245 [Flammula alnicola]|nr:hypothetical protein BDZ97DRAFT_1815245 [Flammula alnicola]
MTIVNSNYGQDGEQALAMQRPSSQSYNKPRAIMGSFQSFLTRSQEIEYYIPTPQEVFDARRCLLKKVPPELANIILDDACYWPKVSARYATDGNYLTLASSNSLDNDASASCLVTPKLSEWIVVPDAFVMIKKVCFRITSHDQGWCIDNNFPGKYQGSWTWFEAAIVRDFIEDRDIIDTEDLQTRIQGALNARMRNEDTGVVTAKNANEGSDVWHIQTNIRACRHSVTHEVAWTSDTNERDSDADEKEVFCATGSKLGRGFVRSLEMSDRVAVIARAKYPGWSNHIGSVDLEIYYSV